MFNFEYFAPIEVCFGKGTVDNVGEYVKKYHGAKVLIYYGGGSVIDSTKAIGYGLTNEGDVWDFFEHTRTANDCMSLGCILTIAAAGSEMSNSCVITKEDNDEKRAYDDDVSRPKFAIMDPELRKLRLPESKQWNHFIILSVCQST